VVGHELPWWNPFHGSSDGGVLKAPIASRLLLFFAQIYVTALDYKAVEEQKFGNDPFLAMPR